MALTNDELQEKRDYVQDLRDQLEASRTERLTAEVDLSNDVAGAELDAEAARLSAELAEAQRLTENVKGSSDVNLAAAQAAMEAAAAKQAAIESPSANTTDGAVDPADQVNDSSGTKPDGK